MPRGRKKKVKEKLVDVQKKANELHARQEDKQYAKDFKECSGINPMLMGQPEKPIKWVRIIFSNGQRFKVPAEMIALDYLNTLKDKGRISQPENDRAMIDVICDSPILVEHLKKHMSWHDVNEKAISYICNVSTSFEDLWKNAIFTTENDNDNND